MSKASGRFPLNTFPPIFLNFSLTQFFKQKLQFLFLPAIYGRIRTSGQTRGQNCEPASCLPSLFSRNNRRSN